jgi:hypothetical protein
MRAQLSLGAREGVPVRISGGDAVSLALHFLTRCFDYAFGKQQQTISKMAPRPFSIEQLRSPSSFAM